MRLQGKTILVAGAGGIGDELARRYAREGGRVLLGDIDSAHAQSIVSEIVSNGGIAQGMVASRGVVEIR